MFLYRAMQAPHVVWNSQVTNAGLNIYMHMYIYMKLFDRNIVNKYRIYLLPGAITHNLIDYIYVY